MPSTRWLAPVAVAALAGAALAATLARPSAAAGAPGAGTLTVSGQSTLSVPPSEAQITVGIQFNAATASGAMAKDGRAMNAIIAALEKAGVARRDLQTENDNLNPNESNPTGNEAPRIVSYTVSDQLQVTTTDLPQVGALIDAAVGAGANEVNGVNFTVANPSALLARADDSALAQAHAQAAALAQAAGESLGALVSLDVGQTSTPLPVFAAAATLTHASAIVPPQSLTVSATVTAVYRLVS